MNELLNQKANANPMGTQLIRRTGQKKGVFRFNLYNKTKQDWSSRVLSAVSSHDSTRVDAAFFSYLVVEKNQSRDPSNICAPAVKFIEDGLQKAGVIPNDGWKNVLGIATYWGIYKNHEHGVYVVMSNREMKKEDVESVCWQHRNVFQEGTEDGIETPVDTEEPQERKRSPRTRKTRYSKPVNQDNRR